MVQSSGRSTTPAEQGEGEWLTPGRFAAVLGVLIFACFPQVIMGWETFAAGDTGQYAYPVASYLRQAFWRGEVPLWNPLSSCGIPFLAQWNTLALYPPSLFYLLLPLSWSFGVFCLAHLFWAGLGMYFLAHRWTGRRLAAAVAGGAFAFNGFMWFGVMWPHLLAAMAWMPWVVLTAERAWRQGGRSLAIAALTGALQMLSGGTEAILLTWMAAGALWMADWAAGAKSSGAALPSGRWPMAWRFGLVMVWVAGLAAAQLLPFLDLNQHSQRTAYYSKSAVASVSPMPLSGWANYLVPLFHCQRRAEGVYFQPDQSWLASYYMGIGVVALALVGVWRARRGRVWVLAGLGVFGLALAAGERGGVYPLARAVVPGVGLIRFPVKFLMLVTFVLPLLAAHGLAWLLELPAERWGEGRKLLLRLGAGLAGAAGLIAIVAWRYPLDASEGVTVAGNAAVRIVFLGLCLGGVWLLRARTEAKTRRFLQAGLVVLLWFDVFTHAPNLSPTVPRGVWEPDLVREAFPWSPALVAGESRAMLSPDTFWRLLKGGSGSLKVDVSAWRMTLFMNGNLIESIPKVDGFFSSDLRDYYEVFGWLYFKTNRQEGLKDFLGISQVGYLTDGVEWRPRPSALPLVTAGQEPVFREDPAALQEMASDSFEPLRTVFLPPEARGQLAASARARARVLSSRQTAHRVEVEVEADAPTMVVIARSYYHRWRARVDGASARLWRANRAFQAVEIPAGRTRVSLDYEDTPFRWGEAISLLSLAGCLAGLGFWRRPALGMAPVGADS